MSTTYPVFGVLRNIIENELVGISNNIILALLVVRLYTSHDFGHCVVELRVTTEFLAFLCVLVLICHFVMLVVVIGLLVRALS